MAPLVVDSSSSSSPTLLLPTANEGESDATEVDPLAHPPLALTMPTEVWFNILDDDFSYFDLRRIKGVCKKLEAMVLESQLPDFDRALFRYTPQSSLPGGTVMTLHPALEETLCTFTDVKHAVIYADNDKEFATKELACINVNALSPSVKKLWIKIGAGGWARNQTGVIAMHVLTRIAQLWSKTVPYWCGDDSALDTDSDVGAYEYSDCNYLDALRS